MMRKSLALLLGALMVLALSLGTAAAEVKQPVGEVSLNSKSIAIGIGVNWGSGTLTYQGNKYPFSVEGLSVADLGIASVSAVGEVYDLKKVEDFAGTYTAVKAGIALGGGAEGVTMSNEHGVIVNLQATQVGIKLSLALQGMVIKMK